MTESVEGPSVASDKSITSLQNQIEQLEEQVSQLQLQNEALQKLVRNLQVESLSDDLTGTSNRRFFDREISRLLGRVEGCGFCLLLADVDQLKDINDQHGHRAGDQVLQDVARQLTKLVGKQGSLARIGGDEFAIVMPNKLLDQAESERKQIVDAIQPVEYCDELDQSKQQLKVTLSIGIAEATADDSPISLFDRADRSLYESKNHSREQNKKTGR